MWYYITIISHNIKLNKMPRQKWHGLYRQLKYQLSAVNYRISSSYIGDAFNGLSSFIMCDTLNKDVTRANFAS